MRLYARPAPSFPSINSAGEKNMRVSAEAAIDPDGHLKRQNCAKAAYITVITLNKISMSLSSLGFIILLERKSRKGVPIRQNQA